MSKKTADKIVERIRKAIDREYRRIAPEMVGDLREICSTGYPPSSSPGKPPHARTGDYANGFYASFVGTNQYQTTFIVKNRDTQLSEWLERGTGRMAARPHFAPVLKDWAPKVKQRTVAAARKAQGI